jgi:hypothetical protein
MRDASSFRLSAYERRRSLSTGEVVREHFVEPVLLTGSTTRPGSTRFAHSPRNRLRTLLVMRETAGSTRSEAG